MGCLIALLLGPRTGIIFVWLTSDRLDQTFDTWYVPTLGWLIAPWTTLAYTFVASGGLSTQDIFVLIVAAIMDLVSYGGSSAATARSSN
jgi:hypothetical protein